jgi:hypothetical protein
VPWCEPCGRFYTPSTLESDGRCPDGHPVADPPSGLPQAADGDGSEPERLRVPWHFWLLVAALVVYLGWRLVQGVGWLLG